jgi:hypothetical protein
MPTDEPAVTPRPLPATYWVVPGRLLVGEHPGSQSRAEAMDRLRRFLSAGVTCFIDLTEPREVPSYEELLPFATPTGGVSSTSASRCGPPPSCRSHVFCAA